jgi:hypothetical protein
MTDHEFELSNSRLLMVADLLEKLHPSRFNYNVWVGRNWAGRPDLSCGTVACALGWATTIPALQEVGLKLVSGKDSDGSTIGYVTAPGLPPGGREGSIEAAMQVFFLTRLEALFLFTPNSPSPETLFTPNSPSPENGTHKLGVRSPGYLASPAWVARHIRDFVEAREPAPAQVEVNA